MRASNIGKQGSNKSQSLSDKGSYAREREFQGRVQLPSSGKWKNSSSIDRIREMGE